MTEINACKERTELEDSVVGTANIVYNMVEAWRRLVTVQGGGRVVYVHRRRRWCITRVMMCNSSIKCRCPMPNATMGG
jgi:hypothetical protein